MLNELDRVRSQLTDEKNGLKGAGSATSAKVQGMIDDTAVVVDSLTSSPKNFEDSIQKQGQYREDALALTTAEPLAQATLELYALLESGYSHRALAYGAWARNVAAWNAELTSAGLKPVSVPAAIR
jgi:hypothetical protein